jgi:sugar transferase EpsL
MDRFKRPLDIGVALGALLATAPIWLGAAGAVALTLGHPVLFTQERIGKGNRPFTLIKFRTMRAPAPGTDPVAGDVQRLTSLGRLLRSSSVDELPSLLNVLKGDMSLVGPRPLLARYLPRYSKEQLRRHEVRPGITGWAQVRGRNRTTWEQRLADDVWYVEHQSLPLDLWILCLTVYKVLRRSDIDASSEATMPEFQGTSPEPSVNSRQPEP